MQAVTLQPKQRVQSIDILRGLAMVVMAIDHVRDYFHITAFTDQPTNLATTTPALFFTRWITHFCAPSFVFLSGVSAYIAGRKKTKSELSSFLIKRGAWLVFIELALITLAWTFNPFYNLFVIQVIWAIGWSMIVLGLLAKTSFKTILAIGIILFLCHDIFDYITLPKYGLESGLLNFLFKANFKMFHLNATHVALDFYAVLPWTAVMLIGYGFGHFYTSFVSDAERRKALLLYGSLLTLIFIVLRFINIYGDPNPWSQQRTPVYTFLSFLNTTKYPPSLLYLCMTLGPALLLLYLLEFIQNALTRILIVFGRVPFFYYVLHLYLIHLICVIVFFATGHNASQIHDPNAPFLFRPQHFGYGLWIVYGIWLGVVIILYFPCRWFNKYKSTHHQWWLSYL
jgi:uncharacterized membrane protein